MTRVQIPAKALLFFSIIRLFLVVFLFVIPIFVLVVHENHVIPPAAAPFYGYVLT